MHAPTAVDEVLDLTTDVPSPSGHVRVTIRGELDISAVPALERALREAVARAARGVDLDLSGTAFCDCSGLNALLTARRHALERGRTLTIRSAGPAVRHLLTATGTWPLFTPGEPTLNHDEQELRNEVVQLRRAMQTRPAIDQARGILMATFALSPEDAWDVLVRISQNTNTKLHVLADELVGTAQDGGLPDGMRQQVTAVLATLPASPEAEEPAPDAS
ncbi:STAS domain-containing protein [Streptomyces justiciae]|uniref:STAS domain-containing protein n=1 Tax=Streptomyces justiciae TaxID=2780140 RepID=UPI0018829B26|nr:STAS domain-containing protein [Streptomyces justiciae]MBE8469976.1 STAS domain-containing protein [Streptomyces justiciae]MCW8381264.1 STAS domain-containing protein [Streptomyces justiciae]